jgi:hypothetical protein
VLSTRYGRKRRGVDGRQPKWERREREGERERRGESVASNSPLPLAAKEMREDESAFHFHCMISISPNSHYHVWNRHFKISYIIFLFKLIDSEEVKNAD